VPKKVPGSTPELVGECSHSRFLSYGAFAMLALYWAAKYPPVNLAVPHLIGLTNTAAGLLSVAVGGQSARQAKAKLIKWWSHHVEIKISGRVTFWLGKKGEQPPP
jgi:hypothetical protein